MQREMRAQFLTYAMPYFRVQSPSVQQHKMAISRTLGLPPDVIHQLLFSFSLKGCIYANSTVIVLAMPNAVDVGALGICSVCTRATRQPLCRCPQCGLPAAHPSLPCGRCLQNPAVAASDRRQRLYSSAERTYPPV